MRSIFSVLVDEDVIKGPGSFIHYEKIVSLVRMPRPGREHSKSRKITAWSVSVSVTPALVMQKEESAGTAFWGISRENLVHSSKVLVGVL